MGKDEKFEIKLRPLTYKDIDPVLTLWWSPIIEKEMIAASVGGRFDLSYIAEADGRLIGFIFARIEYLGIPIEEVCVIHAIVVQPEYRKHGVGKILFDELMKQCAQKGVKTIRALLPKDSHLLLNFLKTLDFKTSNIINMDKAVISKTN
jgi:GNAT superfamily N-acetyltransferase